MNPSRRRPTNLPANARGNDAYAKPRLREYWQARGAADVLGDDEKAQDLYQRLKFRVIGRLPKEGLTLTEDQFRLALAAIEQEPSHGR